MSGRRSVGQYGICIGEGTPGPRNLITDVPGVRVGHCTVNAGENRTGVTVILPCEGFIFGKKPVAACYSLNGFGKTCGTVQIEELGTLETPIALTNTLNVGKVADALVEYTVGACAENGRQLRSVNPVVGETNDGTLNDIVNRAVGPEHVAAAIEVADVEFDQGDVGAGRSTICFGLKGGIGSASRMLSFGGKEYCVGALVQSNFGSTGDLMICGRPVGRQIDQEIRSETREDKGSIMIVIGTDIPLTSRQLKRVLKRATVGLVRVGSHMGHGSGDVFLGFTNGNFMPDGQEELLCLTAFPENRMDRIFRLTAEAVEEAILNSMINADPAQGRDGKVYHSLREFLQKRPDAAE